MLNPTLARQPSWIGDTGLHTISYRLVFDAAHQHYPLWRTMVPWLLGAVLGLVLIRFPRLYDRYPRYCRAFGVVLVAVGFGASFTIWHVSNTQRRHVVRALADGRFRQIEGRVEHFRPGRADGHPPEEFDVAGQHYRYAPAEWLYGFDRVAGAGGPMREGLQVRIADVDGLIARLEIAR